MRYCVVLDKLNPLPTVLVYCICHMDISNSETSLLRSIRDLDFSYEIFELRIINDEKKRENCSSGARALFLSSVFIYGLVCAV